MNTSGATVNRVEIASMYAGLKTLVHALVPSKLVFGNATLCGIAGTLLHRLEMVQRAAARVVLGLRRRDHHSMTAALQRLHWLPVAYRIRFKLLTLMHAAIHANTPGTPLLGRPCLGIQPIPLSSLGRSVSTCGSKGSL